ncbi:MAG: hypothetical protein ACLTGI_07650 [Hoylesella buccalis]
MRQRYPSLKFGTGKIKILRDTQENGVAKVGIDPDGVLVIESIKPGRHSFQLAGTPKVSSATSSWTSTKAGTLLAGLLR